MRTHQPTSGAGYMLTHRISRRFIFVAALAAGLLVSAAAAGQENQSFDQFMVSHELLEELPAADSVHDYGSRVLVRAQPGAFPRELRSRASELESISHLSYRGWEGAVDGEDPARLPSVSDGYFVLSLVGPMAPEWRDQIGAHDLTVVDHVSPYGLLVRGSSRAVHLAADEVRTSEGFSVIVHALRSEEHTSELQSRGQLVCRLLLDIK